jgi:hypothetical protein
LTSAPSPFSPTLPKFQLAWDSTSLGWLKTCPRLYQYQMLEGWEPRSKGIHLTFGSLYASALERYAHAKASGASHDEATLRMVRWALENSGTRTEEGEWEPWSPIPDPDANIKNRYTLVRTLVWNAEERLTSPFSTYILANGKPAVELSFNFPVFSVAGEEVSLSGHIDEVVQEEDGSLWVRDDKTTKSPLDASYFSRYTPDNQMSLYSLAGKVILESPIRGVLVKAAQMGVNFSRFRTGQIPRPSAVLTEWLNDAHLHITRAREYALANYWPLNDKACFLCSFKKVCAVSPSHRNAWLQEDYVRREWNPLHARGDI